jgi:hypothetical protein
MAGNGQLYGLYQSVNQISWPSKHKPTTEDSSPPDYTGLQKVKVKQFRYRSELA